ncbi:hypothetical protein IZU99_04620 [Oscillospiraceae bacterium CM]|nr:hypothetical protein IZU99_04620 [Oscillospiraceae bacterium CM]
MEQTPNGSFISGVIVNDVNYGPVAEEAAKQPESDVQAEEFLPPPEIDSDDCREICDCCADKSEEHTLKPCVEFDSFTVHNVHLHCEGRLLKVRVQLKDVCRGRKIRLAVLLFEKECMDTDLKGMRTCELTVPGLPCGCLNELTIGDFCFILPEEDICSKQQKVKIQVIAHYSSFPEDHKCGC